MTRVDFGNCVSRGSKGEFLVVSRIFSRDSREASNRTSPFSSLA